MRAIKTALNSSFCAVTADSKSRCPHGKKKRISAISANPYLCTAEGADSSARHLYSCGGEGLILQHRPGHFLDDAADVNALIGKTNGVKVKQEL